MLGASFSRLNCSITCGAIVTGRLSARIPESLGPTYLRLGLCLEVVLALRSSLKLLIGARLQAIIWYTITPVHANKFKITKAVLQNVRQITYQPV